MSYEGARRRKPPRKAIVVVVGVVALVLSVVVVVLLVKKLGSKNAAAGDDLRGVVVSRCGTFVAQKTAPNREKLCEGLWDEFSRAFVGQDPCQVPMEAYDKLIYMMGKEQHCGQTLFWSKTKEIAHKFTSGKDCMVTVEDTLLGYVMDGLTWCGRNGSSEILTTGCPGWTQCPLNPVRSFWESLSAAFAASTCGNAAVMLNGSLTTPFNPNSVFASIEVKNFNSTRMNGLAVVLVSRDNDMATCENSSLQDLQKALDPKLTYSCKVVPQAQILDCIADSTLACSRCW